MKYLVEADIILSIKLLRDENDWITLVQSHYVEKFLSRYAYFDGKSTSTPYNPNILLRKDQKATRDELRYSETIGWFIYLPCAVWPYISLAMSKLSQFVANLGYDHWHALERVVLYLERIVSYVIHYTRYTTY
jgi:hypothetical protein